MGYVVCHMGKAKGGSSGGLTNHIDRNNLSEEKSKNIDASRTHLNLELVESNGTIDQMINKRIEQGYKSTRKIRIDAIKSQRYILSASHEEMIKLKL